MLYEQTIYVGSSRIIFTSEPLSAQALATLGIASNECVEHLAVDDNMSVSWAKVVKKVEKSKFVAIITPDIERTFGSVASQMVEVEAAGGVVANEHGELLMILLRERYDLPKGHVERGEQSSEAALREVREETGIVAKLVGRRPLAVTLHAYDCYGRWELKRTLWWQMQRVEGEPQPQRDEGITWAGWCTREAVTANLMQSYDTIKCVVEALDRAESE